MSKLCNMIMEVRRGTLSTEKFPFHHCFTHIWGLSRFISSSVPSNLVLTIQSESIQSWKYSPKTIQSSQFSLGLNYLGLNFLRLNCLRLNWLGLDCLRLKWQDWTFKPQLILCGDLFCLLLIPWDTNMSLTHNNYIFRMSMSLKVPIVE